MRFVHLNVPISFCFTVIVAGCANTCFVAVSNNGSGTVVVKAGSPPPPCSLSQASGTITAMVAKSPQCENCASIRAQHIFLTVRGVQLRPDFPVGSDSSNWIDLADSLAKTPRQIDLLSDSALETLISRASVPAGNYRQAKVQFLSASTESAELPRAVNSCGRTGWNCIVTPEGQAEPIQWADGSPEIVIPLEDRTGGLLLVLPEARIDLRFQLRLQPALALDSTGWRIQNAIAGHIEVAESAREIQSGAGRTIPY